MVFDVQSAGRVKDGVDIDVRLTLLQHVQHLLRGQRGRGGSGGTGGSSEEEHKCVVRKASRKKGS